MHSSAARERRNSRSVIAAARDFFDYWIEREVRGIDLGSLGAKMQVARILAETVSHVRDPMMRGEMVSKVSARLGVAAAGIRKRSLRKQARAPAGIFAGRGATGSRAAAVCRPMTLPCFASWHCVKQTPAIFFSHKTGVRLARANSKRGAIDPHSRKLICDRKTRNTEFLHGDAVGGRGSGWFPPGCMQKIPATQTSLAESGGTGLVKALLRRRIGGRQKPDQARRVERR